MDIFASSYQDLRTYDTRIIQHKIPLKPNTNPFQQKLRRLNPALLPVIEKEVKKLLYAKNYCTSEIFIMDCKFGACM